jgi:hypothetical protein
VYFYTICPPPLPYYANDQTISSPFLIILEQTDGISMGDAKPIKCDASQCSFVDVSYPFTELTSYHRSRFRRSAPFLFYSCYGQTGQPNCIAHPFLTRRLSNHLTHLVSICCYILLLYLCCDFSHCFVDAL